MQITVNSNIALLMPYWRLAQFKNDNEKIAQVLEVLTRNQIKKDPMVTDGGSMNYREKCFAKFTTKKELEKTSPEQQWTKVGGRRRPRLMTKEPFVAPQGQPPRSRSGSRAATRGSSKDSGGVGLARAGGIPVPTMASTISELTPSRISEMRAAAENKSPLYGAASTSQQQNRDNRGFNAQTPLVAQHYVLKPLEQASTSAAGSGKVLPHSICEELDPVENIGQEKQQRHYKIIASASVRQCSQLGTDSSPKN